jgi:hypothetical protein
MRALVTPGLSVALWGCAGLVEGRKFKLAGYGYRY